MSQIPMILYGSVAVVGSLLSGVQGHVQGGLVLRNTAVGAFQTTVQSSNSASVAWTLTLPTTPGTIGQVLRTDGAGITSWVANGGGGGSPGGAVNTVQYNAAGSFGGVSGVTSDGASLTFTDGNLKIAGSSSGTSSISAPATGGGAITLPAGAVTLMANPMTTGGDVIYGGASGVPTRLANGSAGQVLTSNGTTVAPSWGAAGLTNPMTTGGDVIYGGASGVPTRLANGTAGQVLTSAGTTLAPTWSTISGGNITINSSSITGGTSTRLLYDNAGTVGEASGITTDGNVLTIAEAVGVSALTLTGATQTASHPFIAATQTWNGSGIIFKGLQVNITDTLSSALSGAVEVQYGGSTFFRVGKGASGFSMLWLLPGVTPTNANAILQATSGGVTLSSASINDIVNIGDPNANYLTIKATSGSSALIKAPSTATYGITNGTSASVLDTGWSRAAAGVWAAGTGAQGSVAGSIRALSIGLGTVNIASASLAIAAGTTAIAQVNFAPSTAPTSPNDGDWWYDGTNLKFRQGGTTKTVTIV